MAGSPLLSLDRLTSQHQAAVEAWRAQSLPTQLFETWSEVHSAWGKLEESDAHRWTRHISVLWQDLNAECRELESLPLLNEFIRVRFSGISRTTSRDFNPKYPASDAPWHSALLDCLQALAGAPSTAQEELLNALLRQYGDVYGAIVRKSGPAFLRTQAKQLDVARQLGHSELLRPGEHDWAEGPTEFVDLLAWLQASEGEAGKATSSAQSGEGSLADELATMALWASHCPWFARYVQRHAPDWLPTAPTLPAPNPEALKCNGSGALGVLLVGTAEICRHWLLASEASAEAGVQLRPTEETDLETSRSTWQADALGEPGGAGPGLMARRRASHLAQVSAWEVPLPFFRQSKEAQSSATLGLSARRVQQCQRVLETQELCAGLALIEALPLDSPGHAPERLEAYQDAATWLSEHVRSKGGQPSGMSWCLVFERPPEPRVAPAYSGGLSLDERLQEDYREALTSTYEGPQPSEASSLIELSGDTCEQLIRSAQLAFPCQRSPAFARRVQYDLLAVAPLIEKLCQLGFADGLAITYTDSRYAEFGQWPAFGEVWQHLQKRASLATQADRARGFRQRYVVELGASCPSRGTPAGQSAAIAEQLTLMAEADGDSPGQSPGNVNRLSLWHQLEQRIGGGSPLSARDFEPLWKAREEHSQKLDKAQRVRAACLRKLVEHVLTELGIPSVPLSEFAETRHVHESAGIPLNEAEWEALLQLAGRAHPLPEGSLGGVRELHLGYSLLSGSSSHHCLLKDFGPDQPTAELLNEHRFRSLTDVLLLDGVSLHEKSRLVLSLRGYAPDPLRQLVSLKFGELDRLKHQVLAEIWREVLQADLALVYLLRMAIEAFLELERNPDPAREVWLHRREQLLLLLDAGGWNAAAIGEDVAGARATLLRIIDLWKDFYRYGKYVTAKKRAARVESLRQDYEQLRKPRHMPELNVDLSHEKAIAHERGVYLAAHCTELLQRLADDHPGSDTPKGRGGSVDVREISRRFRGQAEALMDDYNRQKARYCVRRAAFELEKSGWLHGFEPAIEVAAADVLAHSHEHPAQLAAQIRNAIQAALEAQSRRATSSNPPAPFGS